MKPSISLVSSLTFCLVGSSLQLSPASAQVTPDGTTNTTVNPDGDNFIIEQGDRIGDNLFHSFDEFSVPTMGSAAFNNANDIANIFSRVTGSNISNIDGLISANGAANLFLINPNGIIFGENARLNLGGSFFASTADSLLFDGDLEFSASNPTAPPLIEVNIPIGLGFRDNPGDIVNRSFVQNDTGDFVALEVAPGQNITLVGGDIKFDRGQATARGGNIQLGGLSAAGTVGISDDGSLSFPEDVERADITLSNAAEVDVMGTVGGSITINAGNLTLEAGEFGSSFINAGIGANSGFDGAQAGEININATGAVNLIENSSIQNRVNEGATGNSGDINVTVQSLTLTEGSIFSTSIFGQGNGGVVNITATDSVSFDNGGAAVSTVEATGVGTAGSIAISTDNFLIDGGIITSSNSGQGDAGNISIAVSDKFTAINSVISNNIGDEFGTPTVGRVGNIEITAREISLENPAQIQAGAFSGATVEGTGTVSLTATESISFTGTNTGILSNNDPGSFGNASNIQLFAPTITLNDGAGITASNAANGQGGSVTIETEQLNLNNGSLIFANAAGKEDAGSITIRSAESVALTEMSIIRADVFQEATGNGGNVNIETGKLIVTNGQVSVSTFGDGNAGNLTINATESIELSGSLEFSRGGLLANALSGSGNGGNINVSSNQLTIDDGGTIEAGNFDSLEFFPSGTGQPGNINIEANSLSLSNRASIEATTQSEIGEAANINLTIAEDIFFKNNSSISARAFENANGGNVTINADNGSIVAFPNQNNDIIANAQQGNGGNINITTQAIFGLEERRSEPPNQTNDIDASSQFGLQGDFSLNTPENEPSRGLIDLPENVVNPEDLISQNACKQGGQSKFTLTGRGGLPATPEQVHHSDEVEVGLVKPAIGVAAVSKESSVAEDSTKIEPAKGWIRNEQGEVFLVGYDPTVSNILPQSENLDLCQPR